MVINDNGLQCKNKSKRTIKDTFFNKTMIDDGFVESVFLGTVLLSIITKFKSGVLVNFNTEVLLANRGVYLMNG